MTYLEPLTTYLFPAAALVAVAMALATGSWLLAAAAPVALGGAWRTSAQRVTVDRAEIRLSFLPFGSAGVRIERAEARVVADGVWVRFERLDGRPVSKWRTNVGVRGPRVSGPPALVARLREHGVFVVEG
jgi:hypothetical protein